MALVTILRSPTPSTDPDLDVIDSSEDTSDGRSQLRKRSRTSKEKLRKIFSSMRFISKLRPCLSESYFTVKGAALILPHTECTKKSTKKSHGGEIQSHLQAMLHLLRPEDTIKIAVRLEDTFHYQRYMALVSTRGRQDTEEAVILGIDCTSTTASIGLVLPMWMGLRIKLGGDGGFSLCTDEQSYLFKPVSVQAMWSAIQSLYKVLRIAEDIKYLPEGLTHTWIGYYRSRIDNRDTVRMSQWNVEGVEVFAPSSLLIKANDSESERIKLTISQTLKEVMMTFDLDEATSVMLRNAVEQKMGISLAEYKRYFDEEIMRIVGQMDKPSQILEFLYLGSEWNASNIEELIEKGWLYQTWTITANLQRKMHALEMRFLRRLLNVIYKDRVTNEETRDRIKTAIGVGYILNVTKEIDNFFEGRFQYYNVRVYDVDESDLLKHWDKTYKFISEARSRNSKVLVHCKMGVSRSASTVMAFIMKDQRMTVDEALQYVKERRSCVHPNSGFMEQLRTYEGILTASNKRDIFRCKSEQNLMDESTKDETEPSEGYFLGDSLYHMSLTDWQSASGGVHSEELEEECICSLHKDEMYNLGILMMDTDLEAAESRSADSTEEALPDIPSLTQDMAVAANVLQVTSTSVATVSPATPLPIRRPSVGVTSVDREMTQEREASSESYTALSSSEGSSSLQFRTSLGALSSRIKPDSSWIKLDTVELVKDDAYSDSLSLIETLTCDTSCSTQPTISALSTTQMNGALTSHLEEVFKPMASNIEECKVIPAATTVPEYLPLSASLNLPASSLSLEKSAAGVLFYIGNIQNPLDIKPAVIATASNADLPLSSSSTSSILSSSAKKSSDFAEFPSDLLISPEMPDNDIKQTHVDQISHGIIAHTLQKDSLDKTPKCRDTVLDKQDADLTIETDLAGARNIITRTPQNKIELGVRQYFFREKIPWKPGKVRKMQEDINKTGQISQEDDSEEDSCMTLQDMTLQDMTLLQDVSDERDLLEQTSDYQPAVSLCQSHSCVELCNSEEMDSNPISIYEREEIPLTAGTVLRTRLEIEERQKLFCGEGDQELFGIAHPLVRMSSLKQEMGTPRSRNTDNHRLTCGSVKPLSHGKSLNDLQSLGVSTESLVNFGFPSLLSPVHIEDSDEELTENNQTMDHCHCISHKGTLEEPPIEAGLVRKHKMELESKCEIDKTQFRTNMRPSSPIAIKTSSTPPAASQSSHLQDSRSSFRMMKRNSTEISQLDSLSSSTSSCGHRGARENAASEIIVQEIGSALLTSPSPPKSKDIGVEPCANMVKYFVRKLENQAVVSTAGRNIAVTDDTKATSPIKDESTKIKHSSVSESGSHPYASHASPNDTTLTRTIKSSDFLSSSTSISEGSGSDFRSAIQNDQLEILHDAHMTGFDKNSFTKADSSIGSSSRMSLDLKVDGQLCILPQTASQTLLEVKNISLFSPVSKGKEQGAALVETGRSEPASSTHSSSHVVGRESPETSGVKNLVGRFENKSPESDRISSDSSHDLILKLKDRHDILFSSPSASVRSEEDQIPQISSIEGTTSQTTVAVSQSSFRLTDRLVLQPYSSSTTSVTSSPASSILSTSPLLSLHRKQASLDSTQNPFGASRNFPLTFDIAIELNEVPRHIDICCMEEISSGTSSIISARKLGPVPFNRSIMESSEKKTWRPVRPKSAEHIQRSVSCSECESPSSDVLQRSKVGDNYGSFSTIDDEDVSLRQVSDEGRKIRRLHGKSHLHTKLSEHCLGKGPFYSSM